MEPSDIIKWPWEGNDVICDLVTKVEGSNLFYGRCSLSDKTDQFVADVMIRKDSKIKKASYDMLKGFQHDTFIPHLNFYVEGGGGNMGRLVVPEVGPSFENWIRGQGGKEDLFDACRKMKPLFSTMIVHLADLLQKLYHDKQVLIKNLDLPNLYLADEITPRILVLVTEVEFVQKISMNTLWKPLYDLTESIYKACGFNYNDDPEARRYLGFLGNPKCTMRALGRYPRNWDEQTKKEYLIALIAAEQNGKDGLRLTTIKAKIRWPKEHGKIPDVLDDIMDHHRKLKRITYHTNIPLDYLRLIRNTYKHFDTLPYDIQQVFGTRSGFLKKIEQWSPDIWKDLYDMIGWP